MLDTRGENENTCIWIQTTLQVKFYLLEN